MELLHEIIIENPPKKYTKKNKKIKLDTKGRVIPETHFYLTANVFYDGTHWALKNWVIGKAKRFLFDHLKGIPKMEKMRLEITYCDMTDTFDLDNKAYFWTKCILDILKTPTSDQILRARDFNNEILTVEAIHDDTVRYVDSILMQYRKDSPAIELKIFGRLAATQQSLF